MRPKAFARDPASVFTRKPGHFELKSDMTGALVSTTSSTRRPATRPSTGPHPPDEIDSGLLLGSDKRVRIHHRGQVYELRETRQGKLILTK